MLDKSLSPNHYAVIKPVTKENIDKTFRDFRAWRNIASLVVQEQRELHQPCCCRAMWLAAVQLLRITLD
jgi:hypothetical protein